MKKIRSMTIDCTSKTLSIMHDGNESSTLSLFTPEAFNVISELWVKVGWASRFSYNFTWLGRPIIQLPEDVLTIQEVIYKVRPDVIVETGVAHGGSSVFYASLFEIFSHGRVISIDVEIRPHNRKALEEHPLKKRITLIEGSSIAPETVQQVRALIAPNEKVMVILDSNHSKDHVHQELEMYSLLVGPGSYVVVADGNMDDLCDVPGGKPEWATNNPRVAVHEFLASHPEFEIDPEPTRLGVT